MSCVDNPTAATLVPTPGHDNPLEPYLWEPDYKVASDTQPQMQFILQVGNNPCTLFLDSNSNSFR